MANCPNKNSLEFRELEDIFGESIAIYLWDKNGGYPLDLTKDGNPSALFNEIMATPQINNDRVKAIKVKAQIYKKDFTVEPSYGEIEIRKEVIANSTDNMYQAMTMEEYDAIPYQEFSGLAKIKKYYYKSEAQAMANKYGVKLIETVEKNAPVWKVVVSKPMQETNLEAIAIEDFDIDEDFAFGFADVESEELPDHVMKAISNKYELIQVLKKKLAQKSPRSSEIKAKIANLKKQISKMTNQHKDNAVKNVVAEDLSIINSNLRSVSEKLKEKLSEAELENLQEILYENSLYIKGWNDVYQYFSKEEDAASDQVRGFANSLSRANQNYNKLSADIMARYGNTTTSRNDLTSEELLAPVEDVSEIRSKFFSIGETNIPLLKVIDDLIKIAARRVNKAARSRKTEIGTWLTKLEKHTGKTRADISKMFLQLDDNGNWTGNFIGRYKQSFYDKMQVLKDHAYESGVFRDYNRFMRENSYSMEIKDLEALRKMSLSEIKKQKSDWMIGKFSREEAIEQKELLDQYYKDKDAHAELTFMNDKYAEGTLDKIKGKWVYKNKKDARLELEFQDDMSFWEGIYSPYAFAGAANKRNKEGYLYTINPKPTEKWLSPQYDEIAKDKEIFAFYEYMRDTFKENNKSLPFFNNLQDNYLPEVKKGLYEMVKGEKNFLKKWKLLGSGIKTGMTDEVASGEDSRAIIGNKDMNSVPVSMMGGKMLSANKVSDVFTVLEEHSKMAFNYKYHSQIESMTSASQDMIDNIDEIKKVDANGNPVTVTKWGRAREKSGRLHNAKAALTFAINTHLYKMKSDPEFRSGKTIKVINENGEVETREYTGSKLIEKLNMITYYKQLGFPNFIGPTVNATFGFISNMSYASAGQDVSEKEMLKANTEMISITSKTLGALVNEKTARKTYAFMEEFQLLGDIHDGQVAGKKSLSSIITILQSKAEFLNQGALMLGILRTQKLKDKNGNDVNIFDAYNEKDGQLIWNTEKMGEQKEVPTSRIYSEDMNQVNLTTLGLMIDEVNQTVHGDYKNTMMIKNKALNKAVMLYKTWLPRAIDHRFGAQRMNQNLLGADGSRGREVKGRYRSYTSARTKDGVDLLFRQTMGLMAKSLVMGKRSFSDLAEIDRVNLIRNMRELQFIAAIYGMVLMLSKMADDGDEDINFQLNMLINMLSKTQADLGFFLNPNSAGQLFNNLIPALSTVGDLFKIAGAMQKTIAGNATYESGPWNEKSRLGVAAMRALPGTAGSVKLYNYGSRIFEYK